MDESWCPIVDLFDYAFPLLLILSVVRQLRGKRLTFVQLGWPVALVTWAAVQYVRGFPATGADVGLVVGCAVAGLVLGLLAGRCTRVTGDPDGRLVAYATWTTVALWSTGAVLRLAFGLYAEHGGAPTIGRFSTAHGLVAAVWAPALTLMALAEVLGRTAVLAPPVVRDAAKRRNRAGTAAHPQRQASS